MALPVQTSPAPNAIVKKDVPSDFFHTQGVSSYGAT
jgi:hypothetical protein